MWTGQQLADFLLVELRNDTEVEAGESLTTGFWLRGRRWRRRTSRS